MEKRIEEPAKEIPVLAEADIVVAGGGMSGVVAAVAAARQGARTILAERYACLGGVAVMGLPIQGYCSDTGEQIVMGIPEEFRQRMIEKGGAVDYFIPCKMHNPYFCVDPETVKIVCQEMLLEAGVTVLLDTMVVDTVGTKEHLDAVIIEGKSGRQAITAKAFIDATGDADLVVRMGASWFMSRTDELQANTLGIILKNVDKKKFQKYLEEDPENFDLYPLLPREQIANSDYFIMAGLTKTAKKATRVKKFENLYGMVNFVALPQDDAVYVNSVHVSGYNPCDTVELSEMEMEGRSQVEMVVEFMRSYVPGFEEAKTVMTGPWIGIRESRIIDGVECLTLDAIKKGSIPDNTIALGGYPYDFHQKDSVDNKVQFYKIPAYGIPYGCLIPKGTSNVFVAGKTISATREAMCSSRVMAQCMAEGQAAGTAAAMCAMQNVDSMGLDVGMLREQLINDNVKLS